MTRRGDPPLRELVRIEIANVRRGSMIDGQPHGQVEVAVIHGPVPIHANLMAAHQPLERPGIERPLEQPLILGVLFLLSQNGPVATDRHVRQGMQPGETNPEAPVEFPAVILFETFLVRRKDRAERVIDQIQWKLIDEPIAVTVQLLNGSDTPFVDACPRCASTFCSR
jgi:hypothetical protein